ncbi:40S ribosomal S1 [Tubulinosema ratisbonensis]|uniref:40S ribosomal S1 n=1 Tax=Tubulinosema ratisbonensis TaxID=291195 RepID=A0A437AKW5_9MICR|nr:40S ribosomal S1 [Tubulinosema ratisbonensis]
MKKGLKKKAVDTFAKKEWYTLKVPGAFIKTDAGKTLVNKQSSKALLDRALLGRNFEACQGDLNPNDETNSFRKFKFVISQVDGSVAKTEFNGMDLTKDKKKGIIRKWHTLVKTYQDVLTKDGYTLRIFVMGITKRELGQTKKTCYAKRANVKRVRKVIFNIIENHFSDLDLLKVMDILQGNKVTQEIEKKSLSIVPLENVFISKVKVVGKPKKEEVIN